MLSYFLNPKPLTVSKLCHTCGRRWKLNLEYESVYALFATAVKPLYYQLSTMSKVFFLKLDRPVF